MPGAIFGFFAFPLRGLGSLRDIGFSLPDASSKGKSRETLSFVFLGGLEGASFSFLREAV